MPKSKKSENVPKAMEEKFNSIVALTDEFSQKHDEFSQKHLNEEYAS